MSFPKKVNGTNKKSFLLPFYSQKKWYFCTTEIIKNARNILIFKYLYVILHHGCVKLVTRIQ
nr:MAG TPA: hypothetical protein [Caudoviricetes sp.]